MQIKSRITAWYLGVTLAILLAFGISIYVGMRHLLYSAMDRELERVAQQVAENFDPATNHLTTAGERLLNLKRAIDAYHLVIINADQDTVFQSSTARTVTLDIPSPGEQEQEMLTVEIQPFTRFNFNNKDQNSFSFRAISKKVRYNENYNIRIGAALPLAEIEASMDQLFLALLFSALLVLAGMAAGGYVLTHKTLDPVNDIITKAQKISRTNLSERIEIRNERDELGKLSRVLNDLFDRLQDSFDTQQQFMADAAHELKNPLAILRAHLEGEINNPELSDTLKSKLVQDVETVGRMNYLINNLQFLAKSDETNPSWDFRDVDLAEVIRDVGSDCQVLAENKHQSLAVDTPRTARFHGDPTRLYQLFFNLVENAIKYTQNGGQVSIGLKQDGPGYQVKVKDNGPGIPPNDLPRVFNRFYRVHKDRSRQSGGSGLGLAIARVIAEGHLGKLTVENNNGPGCSFTVELPAEPAASRSMN